MTKRKQDIKIEDSKDVTIIQAEQVHYHSAQKEILHQGNTTRATKLFNQTPPEPDFIGRQEFLEKLTGWYKDPIVRIGALIGWGGVGKSAIVRKWYDLIEINGIRPDGIFWWGFYRNNSLDRFLDSLLDYLAHGMANSNECISAWAKVDKINELIQENAYLIIFDGFEQMQKSEERGDDFGCMQHRELSEILTNLV